MILVVNASAYEEDQVIHVLKNNCRLWKIRARNIEPGNVSLAIEVRTKRPGALVQEISDLESVTSASLVEHDGDITA